jgi:hypothetical protein
MINLIIKLLQSDEWYGVSKEVEIAKGEKQYCTSLKQVGKQYKRAIKWRMK